MSNWNKKSKKILLQYRKELPLEVYQRAENKLNGILQYEHVEPENAAHCYANIFPMIALYCAIKDVDEAHAYEITSNLFWNKQVIPSATWIRRFLKIPKLYRLIPRLAASSVKKHYQPSDDGFQYEFLEISPNRFRVDFHQCLYYNYCLKYEVPELCSIFCTSDEIVAHFMKPHIVFKRTQTLAQGGHCCDFLYQINEETHSTEIRSSTADGVSEQKE